MENEASDPPLRLHDIFTALAEMETALAEPLLETLASKRGKPLLKSMLDTVREALRPIQRAFGAVSVLCWCATDDRWQMMGEQTLPESVVRQLGEMVERASATGRQLHRSSKGFGRVSVFPVTLGTAHGALTILRATGAALSKEEKSAAAFIAQRMLHAVMRSIAWRQDREAALHWRAIIDTLPIAMIVRDADRRVLDYNEAALDLAANAAAIRQARREGRQPPAPVWDTYLPSQKPITPDDIPSVRAIRDRTIVYAAQMEVAPDGGGSLVPVLATSVPLPDAKGNLTRTVTVVHDISEAKRVEKMKDTFAQRVRHDVNQPLSITKMTAYFIHQKCQKVLTGEIVADEAWMNDIATNIDRIREASNAIESVTADLSNLDTIISGTPARMSLVDFLRERIPTFKTRYPDHRFVVDYDAADALLEGFWCRWHIESIVTNLLENAVKYSPKQTTVMVKVFADTYEGKRTAHLVVADQGFGISEHQQESIFDKNVRLTHHDETGQPIPGTGEGLHYVKICAMMYGGKPWVTSSGPNQGSEFHVRLPLAE